MGKRGKLSVKRVTIASLAGQGYSRVPTWQSIILTISCLFLMQSSITCNEQHAWRTVGEGMSGE